MIAAVAILALAAQRAPSDEWSVYDVQSRIDFDTLEGVGTDPATGEWWLFGRCAYADRIVRVPYLDHLATALECRSPRFSLEWTSENRAKVNRALATDASGKHWRTFDEHGRLTPAGQALLASVGAQVRPGDDRYDALAALLAAKGRPDILGPARCAGAVLRALAARQDLAGPQAELIKALDYEYSHREAVRDRELDAFWLRLLAKAADLYGLKGGRYQEAYRRMRDGGGPVEAALASAWEDLDEDVRKLSNRLHEDVHRGQIVYLPADVVRDLLAVEPQVHPVFKDLPERSMLARVAFDADVLLKTALHRPDLAERIPGWKTQIAWECGRNLDQAYEAHAWIAAEGFELVESRDGRSMRFARTPARFYMNRYEMREGERVSVKDPVMDEYAREITAHFDALAREFEVLHEVRECLKVVAVARWLQKRKFTVRLPRAGRASWNPPRELPGVIHVAFEARAPAVAIHMLVAGGVDLASEETWKISAGDFDDLRNAVAADPRAKLTAPPVVAGIESRNGETVVKLSREDREKMETWAAFAQAHEEAAERSGDWRRLQEIGAMYERAGLTGHASRAFGKAKAEAAKDPAKAAEWRKAVYDEAPAWGNWEQRYCNYYAEAAFRRAGVPTDIFHKSATERTRAEEIARALEKDEGNDAWEPVEAAKAQERIDRGEFVIAVSPRPPDDEHGHIAIGAPSHLREFAGEVSTKEGPKTYSRSASHPLVRDNKARDGSMTANWRWGSAQRDKSGDDDVKYYVYSPKP